MNQATEKEIELSCLNYLRLIGAWAQKINSGKMLKSYPNKKTGHAKMYSVKLADAGTPDILACIKGKFVGIEVKKKPAGD